MHSMSSSRYPVDFTLHTVYSLVGLGFVVPGVGLMLKDITEREAEIKESDA